VVGDPGGGDSGGLDRRDWRRWFWDHGSYAAGALALAVAAWFCPERLPLTPLANKLLVLTAWLVAELLLLGIWRTVRNKAWRWRPFLLGIGASVVTPIVCFAIGLPYVIWLLDTPETPVSPTSTGVRVLPSEPDGYQAISKSLVFLGDNQTHYLMGKSFKLQSAQIDRVSAAAIRPPVLNLFSRPLVEWSLRHVVKDVGGAVIHLGDALDISCKQEFHEFQQIVNTTLAKKKWALAPGNHDGFFFGNFDDNGLVPGWDKACDAAARPEPAAANRSGRMDKSEFIRAYLKLLQQTHSPRVLPCLTNGPRDEATCAGFYRRVFWNIEKRMRRSYIVQELNVGIDEPTSLVLLDTAAYDKGLLLPTLSKLIPFAGARGEIIKEQFKLVQRWIRSAPKRRFLLAGHHNFEQLTRDSKKRLTKLLREPNVYQAFVSAHSHNGRFDVRENGRHGDWLELNVGSLLDWPQEWLELEIGRANGRPIIRNTRAQLRNVWAQTGRNYNEPAPDCERSTDYGGAYVHMKSSSAGSARSFVLIAQNIALAYTRLVNDHVRAPAEFKRLVARVSHEIEKVAKANNSPNNEEMAVIRRHLASLPTVAEVLAKIPEAREDLICQAYWASQYDDGAFPSDTRSPWLQLPGQHSAAAKEPGR